MFGDIIRSIREAKGISLVQLSDGIMAKSQLSRYERGETDISVSRFFQLINRLNVTFDEILVFSRKKDDFRELINKISPCYSENNIEGFKKILEEQEHFLHKDLHTVTMLKAVLYEMEGDLPPKPEELYSLTDYLFGTEYWGQYEITLLGNCAPLLSFETLYLLTVEVIKKRQPTLSQDPGNRKLIVQLGINCLEESIKRAAFDQADWLIDKIEQILILESEFFEQTILTFMKGFYRIIAGDCEGHQLMEDALIVLKVMSTESIYQAYQKKYEHIKSHIKI